MTYFLSFTFYTMCKTSLLHGIILRVHCKVYLTDAEYGNTRKLRLFRTTWKQISSSSWQRAEH